MSGEPPEPRAPLSLAGPPKALPFDPTPPVLCAATNRRFLVAGRDEAKKTVILATLDPDGSAAGDHPLPLEFVADMARCGDRITLLGGRGGEVRALHLDGQGRVVDDETLPIGPDLLLAPQIACGFGAEHIVWVDGRQRLSVLSSERLSTFALDGLSVELAVAATPAGLTLLRTVGVPGHLEALRVENGRIRGTSPVPDSDQAYSPVLSWHEDGLDILWISRSERAIRWQRLGPDLVPLAPAKTLLSAEPPSGIRWLRCLSCTEREIVVAWQEEQPGDGLDRRGRPTAALTPKLALVDRRHGTLHGVTPIHHAAESYLTGCRSGDTLLVVLGGAQAVDLRYRIETG